MRYSTFSGILIFNLLSLFILGSILMVHSSYKLSIAYCLISVIFIVAHAKINNIKPFYDFFATLLFISNIVMYILVLTVAISMM